MIHQVPPLLLLIHLKMQILQPKRPRNQRQRMGGKSPSQVCKEINELKLGNALVKLKSDGDVLPWIRNVFSDEGAKGRIQSK
jgi:hypothetical protein